MVRVFFILIVFVFLGQATHVTSFMAEIECIEKCPDGGIDSQCAPFCLCDTCSTRHKPLTTFAQLTLPQQQFLQYMPLQQTSAPLSPLPFEIFHVPKPVLA
jgi:hypothetical protein